MSIRHPLTLITKETKPISFRQNNTCLLMQDLNFPFTNIERGWIGSKSTQKEVAGEFDEYFSMVDRVQTNVTAILCATRRSGIKVIYTCLGYYGSDGPSPFQISIGGDWNLDGIAGTYFPQWQPKTADPVFSKPGWGASSAPDFKEFIDSKKIENVFILGSMFGLGIRQSSIELADKGLAVLIVSDAVTDMSYVELQAGLLGIAHGLIKVRSSGEVIDIIGRINSTEEVVV